MQRAQALRLGSLLTRGGLVDAAGLEEALRRHEASGAPLGEVLVAMGRVERDELPLFLAVQAGLRTQVGSAALLERLRIGRLLVEAGAVDRATLEQALEASRRSGRRIGEVLVERGAISGRLLSRFLGRQRRLVAVALAGLSLLAGTPAPAEAGDTARVDVRATVLPRAAIDREQLPAEVVLSSHDVARGYLDLEQPVEVGIRTNHVTGVVLGLSPNSPSFAGIDVRAAQGGVVRAGAVFVAQTGKGLRAHTVSLHVRLMLSPDAAPGTIAHPFSVFLAPG